MSTTTPARISSGVAADDLRVAIIGCGYWGVNYVRLLHETPGISTAVVCDQRTERLAEVQRRFAGPALVTDIDDALALKEIDAVIVCTEASSHHDVVRRCLLAGKHVLVEKPLATCSDQAWKLAELAHARQLVLMVGHTFLYNNGIRKVKEYLTSSAIGKIYYLYAQRTNLGPFRRDVNALWDLAAHDISIFNYWLDERPERVGAVSAKVLGNCREDVGFITLHYASGIVGHVHVSWADPSKVRSAIVVGSKMRIVFDDVNTAEPVRVYEKGVAPMAPEAPTYGEHQLLTRDGDIVSPRVPVAEPLRNQIQHFQECIKTGQSPLTTAEFGADVVSTLEAIDRSAADGGRQVPVKRNFPDSAPSRMVVLNVA